jgi:hypothetical protein
VQSATLQGAAEASFPARAVDDEPHALAAHGGRTERRLPATFAHRSTQRFITNGELEANPKRGDQSRRVDRYVPATLKRRFGRLSGGRALPTQEREHARPK